MTRILIAFTAAVILAASVPLPGNVSLAQQPPAASAPQIPAGRGGPPVQGAEDDIPVVARFDRNGDKILDHAERLEAREYLAAHPELRRPVRGGRINRTGSPGVKLSPRDVKAYSAKVPLYVPDALRTFFLQFDHDDWEQHLAAFGTLTSTCRPRSSSTTGRIATLASASAATTRSRPSQTD